MFGLQVLCQEEAQSSQVVSATEPTFHQVKAEKLKINSLLPRGGSLSFASGSFRRGMFLFVSVAPRRLFHPLLAFTFPFPRSWRLFNNKTPPRRVPTQTAEPLKTQRLPRPPSNKPIQSAAQEEDRAATLRDLMSRQFDFNGDDD